MSKFTLYTLREIQKLKTLPKATQIAYKSSYDNLHKSLRVFYPLMGSEAYYYHHGVYLGDSDVIHFNGVNKTDAKPRKLDILEFLRNAQGGKLYEVEYTEEFEKLPVEETLSTAKLVLENPEIWPKFQIFENNCESFAAWLTTGTMVSAQSIKAVEKIINVASHAAVAAAVSGAVVTGGHKSVSLE